MDIKYRRLVVWQAFSKLLVNNACHSMVLIHPNIFSLSNGHYHAVNRKKS